MKFSKKTVNGVPLYETVVDLRDPDTFISIELANEATEANAAGATHGDQSFEALVKRHKGALVINGTFFSKDDEKRVMGNMVSAGRFLKYSRWENYGTTLGLKSGNVPEMVTARREGHQPHWSEQWFSITCGPRLLEHGEPAINAEMEGFSDSHVLTIGPRTAIGFTAKGDKLILATFLRGLSLEGEAEMMKGLGCSEAMNLDGGASRALAYDGNILIPAGRPLTNVIVVYDAKHPAPPAVINSWDAFQDGQRPPIPGQWSWHWQ